jgi:hypothetical protein
VKPIHSPSDGCSYIPPKHLNISHMVHKPKTIPSSIQQWCTAYAWKVLPIFHITSWHPSRQQSLLALPWAYHISYTRVFSWYNDMKSVLYTEQYIRADTTMTLAPQLFSIPCATFCLSNQQPPSPNKLEHLPDRHASHLVSTDYPGA